jgi:hypothetical protein
MFLLSSGQFADAKYLPPSAKYPDQADDCSPLSSGISMDE